MNDIRRTILVIFGFSMVLLWKGRRIHNGNKATFFPTPPANGQHARGSGLRRWRCRRAGGRRQRHAGLGAAAARRRQRAAAAIPRERVTVSTGTCCA